MSGIAKLFGGGTPKESAPAPAPAAVIIPQADTEELEKQRKRDLVRRSGARQATTGLSDSGNDTLG